jgi:uncharacterized protein YjbI with pentapeptide repeats
MLRTVLTGALLDRADLTGASLTSANLTGARMVGAAVGGATLQTAVLTGLAARALTGTPTLPVNWRLVRGALLGPRAVVTQVDLAGADLAGINLSFASITSLSVAGADLTGANLTHALLNDVEVDGAVLTGATVSLTRGVNLTGQPAAPAGESDPRWTVEQGYLVGPGVYLDRARLTGVDLSYRDLSGANLSGAVLTDVDLRGSSLSSAALGGTVLTRPLVDGLDLSGVAATKGLRAQGMVGTIAELPGPTWTQVGGSLVGPGAELERPDLAGADLHLVDLTGTTLWFPKMGGADLHGASLAAAYIWSADMRGADLSGANLANAVLQGSDLTDADLTGASLAGVYSVWVNWAGADLTGADLTGSQIFNTGWDDAICPDGVIGSRHYQQSCYNAVDSTTPVVTTSTLPTFLWSATALAKVSIGVKDAGTVDRIDTVVTQGPAGGSSMSVRYPDAGDSNVTQTQAWVTSQLPESVHYCVRARAADRAGNISAWSTSRCTTSVTDESWLARSGGWSWLDSEKYYGGNAIKSSSRGSWLQSKSGRWRQVGVVAATCPTCGSVALYVGSTKVGSINLARSTVKSRTLLLLPRFATAKYGKVKVVVTSGSSSTVRIDAVAITGY